MSRARVLVTGAFGNVGAQTTRHLIAQGYATYALDLDSPANRRAAGRETRVQACWADLTDARSVERVVSEVQPDAVIHIAALIAPLSFVRPQLAQAVNVGGTRHLLDACAALPRPPRFIYTSSYTVHGPRNPHRDLPPIDGETPLAPADPYARQKADSEVLVADSGLPWSILRLPAVLSIDPAWGTDPAFLKFWFHLDPTRREHVLDARDAGLALTNAVQADVIERRLALGGPETDCRVLGFDYHQQTVEAMGLAAFDRSCCRRSHPDVDESWYGEDWVDTRESERLLRYQRHTFADHVRAKRAVTGWRYWPTRMVGPLVRGALMRRSPYFGRPAEPDPTAQWEVVRRDFGLPSG